MLPIKPWAPLEQRNNGTSLHGAHRQFLLARVLPPRRYTANQGTQLPFCSCLHGWFHGSPGMGISAKPLQGLVSTGTESSMWGKARQGPVSSTRDRTHKPNGPCVVEQKESPELPPGGLGPWDSSYEPGHWMAVCLPSHTGQSLAWLHPFCIQCCTHNAAGCLLLTGLYELWLLEYKDQASE